MQKRNIFRKDKSISRLKRPIQVTSTGETGFRTKEWVSVHKIENRINHMRFGVCTYFIEKLIFYDVKIDAPNTRTGYSIREPLLSMRL